MMLIDIFLCMHKFSGSIVCHNDFPLDLDDLTK